ncbi:MAG: hypothetical protein CVT48_05585 [Thermoplasmata archaeon HGW-Thermoplasmata-1]|nr:MAG: hypothetical protein CVT48_05585 [Thermoplasmata archaeon HGW-Thermoplasmata-1]
MRMKGIGFDNETYLSEQTAAIMARVRNSKNKLYLEFGGKLVFDYHASRVLPGYDPNVKMRLLQELKDEMEVILCIYAGDIEKKKMRADFGITYESDIMKTMDELKQWGIGVVGVVITRFEGQPAAEQFKKKLERRGVKVYIHRFIKGYPADAGRVVSEEGFGMNEYVETVKPLVVVTGPGPCSGKLSTCLSQMYHDHKRGIVSGYSKFETFPVWNLPLKHPVNMAYEAATAELGDINMIDPFHLEAYGTAAVNYNRDIEIFPVLKKILERITGMPSIYNSPTDMGVNRVGSAITDDEAVAEASKQEITRRYFNYAKDYVLGLAEAESVEKLELLMQELGITPIERSAVEPARRAAEDAKRSGKGNKGIYCGAALQLAPGNIVIGKNSALMHSVSSMLLNALKALAGIPDRIHLLSPNVMESIRYLKEIILESGNESLDLEETLIALAISAASNPTAAEALEQLKKLRGCEVHLSHIPTPGDEAGLKRIGVNYTSDPKFSTDTLFVN